MERTESGLGTNIVELFDEVGVEIVWTIVEGVTFSHGVSFRSGSMVPADVVAEKRNEAYAKL